MNQGNNGILRTLEHYGSSLASAFQAFPQHFAREFMESATHTSNHTGEASDFGKALINAIMAISETSKVHIQLINWLLEIDPTFEDHRKVWECRDG